jgi:NADH dehydrogenase (ubiquinone) 1 beta subcomplex subunit 8
MWGPDVAPIDPYVALRHFLVAVAGFVAAGYTIKEFLTPDVPATRREYPYDGLVKELGGLEENKVGLRLSFSTHV